MMLKMMVFVNFLMYVFFFEFGLVLWSDDIWRRNIILVRVSEVLRVFGLKKLFLFRLFVKLLKMILDFVVIMVEYRNYELMLN